MVGVYILHLSNKFISISQLLQVIRCRVIASKPRQGDRGPRG